MRVTPEVQLGVELRFGEQGLPSIAQFGGRAGGERADNLNQQRLALRAWRIAHRHLQGRRPPVLVHDPSSCRLSPDLRKRFIPRGPGSADEGQSLGAHSRLICRLLVYSLSPDGHSEAVVHRIPDSQRMLALAAAMRRLADDAANLGGTAPISLDDSQHSARAELGACVASLHSLAQRLETSARQLPASITLP